MTQYLPPNLLALFAPRDPIPYLPPTGKLPHEKKENSYNGVSLFLKFFEDPKDTPPPTRVETREERAERKGREKAEQAAYKLEQGIALWEPANNASATSDPFKTLFIARINYDTSESKLRREFEMYGAIKKIVISHNSITGKPRGYGFIEYEHERDMHSAYKHADGKKIDGRRILVDVERGRTVKGWLPRRLGGGLGGTRRGGEDVNTKHSGREDNRPEERERDRSDAGDRGDREERRRSRSRSREKERKRRSRSRERKREPRDRDREPRDRDREPRDRDREPRDRDRERKRRSRSRDHKKNDIAADGVMIEDGEGPQAVDEEKPRERKRSRSRERDRERGKRRRSRSRSRERRRRDRDRGDRDRDRRGDRKDIVRGPDGEEIRIKQEPVDDEYNNNGGGGDMMDGRSDNGKDMGGYNSKGIMDQNGEEEMRD